MSDSIKFETFPSNEAEALAYLYVQSQDLTGKTPVEIYEMFCIAHYEILKDRRKKTISGWFRKKSEEVMQE